MKNYLFFIVFICVILSSCASNQSKTRRGDFIAGCAVGAYSMSNSLYLKIPYEEIVYKCVEIYDTKKEEIDPYLDQIGKELEKVKVKEDKGIPKQYLKKPSKKDRDIYQI